MTRRLRVELTPASSTPRRPLLVALGATLAVVALTLPAAAQPSPTDAAIDGVRGVVEAYDAARAALAADRKDDVVTPARQLAERARRAATASEGALASSLASLAEEAARLGREAPHADLTRARALFGEVSRHLVAALRSHPRLREGLVLYRCPMARGYQLWVQRRAGRENPYMGPNMLTCGTDASF
ncbi:MAG: DUF3347 domain-containing protein [Myxococcales bacterium]|nr:DUF3347 domain-containing protein [Myxococcales bacterium]